jgi:hypothetical protein
MVAVAVKVNVTDPDAFNTYNIKEFQIDNEQMHEYLILREIVPYCYPVLTMGVNVSKYYLNDLKSTAVLERDDNIYTSNNTQNINKAMGILRIAGYDTGVTLYKRNQVIKRYRNWAANTNGHYMPSVVKDCAKREWYELDPADISKRLHHWCELPNFGDTLKLTMTCTIKNFKINIDGTPFCQPGPTVSIVKATPDNDTINIIGKLTSYIPVEIDLDVISAYQGFRTAADLNQLVATQVLGAGW